jgi:hypothetical protein
VTDRPIIMTPANVRALLREAAEPGTGKSETRRLLYSLRKARGIWLIRYGDYQPPVVRIDPGDLPYPEPGKCWALTGWHECKPGDRLWVREECFNPTSGQTWRRGWYRRADESACRTASTKDKPGRRASFHMPRIDSRLTILVTRVKIERLQDISGADARAEGVDLTETVREFKVWHASHRAAYRALWDSLHPWPNAWDQNPWVVAIGGHVVAANIDVST